MSADDMRKRAQRPWNARARVPLASWLRAEAKAEDAARLRCIGNVVMPACARLALHVMAHRATAHDSDSE